MERERRRKEKTNENWEWEKSAFIRIGPKISYIVDMYNDKQTEIISKRYSLTHMNHEFDVSACSHFFAKNFVLNSIFLVHLFFFLWFMFLYVNASQIEIEFKVERWAGWYAWFCSIRLFQTVPSIDTLGWAVRFNNDQTND